MNHLTLLMMVVGILQGLGKLSFLARQDPSVLVVKD